MTISLRKERFGIQLKTHKRMKRVLCWLGALILGAPAPALAHGPTEAYFTLLWYLGCSIGLLGFLVLGPSLFRRRLGACLFTLGLIVVVWGGASFVKDHFFVWVGLCAAPIIGLISGYRIFECSNAKDYKTKK